MFHPPSPVRTGKYFHTCYINILKTKTGFLTSLALCKFSSKDVNGIINVQFTFPLPLPSPSLSSPSSFPSTVSASPEIMNINLGTITF